MSMQVIIYDPILKGYVLTKYTPGVTPRYQEFYERRVKLKDFNFSHLGQDGFRLTSLNDLIRWVETEGEKHVD
jgi:hypothetical protein